jgi:signal transduction histidine kinase/CheY-like chemotaxis protein/AraC-like DNA-binding protein/ligand-binding sensor domain-containing protein
LNRQNNILFLLAFLFLLIPKDIIAQEYLFDIQYISLKDGLPNRQVMDLKQDIFGNIWGNSPEILFKYDGYTFQTFKRENLKVITEDYPTFGIDDKGLVWYRSTDVSLQILNPFTEKVQSVDQFLAAKKVKVNEATKQFITSKQLVSQSTDKSGRIQFLGYNGLWYDYQNSQIKEVYKHYNPIIIKGVYQEQTQTHIFFDKDTLFFLPPGGGIEKRLMPKKLNNIKIFNGIVYVGYKPDIRTSIYSWFQVKNKETVPLVFPNKEWQTGGVVDFVVDALGYQWLISGLYGNDKAIVCISPKGKVVYDEPVIINEKKTDLRKLFIDKQQNVWVTSTEGLFKITRRKIPFKKFLNINNPRGIIKIDGQIVIADGTEVSQTLLTSKAVSTLCDFRDGSVFLKEKNILWVGSYSNLLMRKDLKTGVERIFYFPENSYMYVPFRPKKSEKLWIGTSQGLCYLTENSDTIQRFITTDALLNIATIKQAHQNEKGTWLVTNKGLFLIDAKANVLEKCNLQTGFPTGTFNYLHQDKEQKGTFWIGTGGSGLIRWQPKTNTIKIFGRANGFLNENIYAVFEDDYGFLWLPSDYGLIRFNKETFEGITYLPEHGLPHEEFNTYSHYEDEEGNFYFGGLGGLISFHPKDIVNKVDGDVPLYFKTFKRLKNKETIAEDITAMVKKEQILTIRPDDKFFEIYFTLMDFKKKDKLYAYKIKGYDNDWNYTTDNFIRINSLPYGKYQLEVRGQIDGTTWSKTALTLNIKVMRPFYLQIWFILLSLVLLGVSIWQYTRYQTVKLTRDKEILENTVAERTAKINQQAEDLRVLDKTKTQFFSNITHEFRTPLTLIIGPVQQITEEVSSNPIKKRLQAVSKNAQLLLNLINQLLDLSKLESGKMELEIVRGDIIHYTQTLLENFQPLADKKEQTLDFISHQAIWETNFDEKKWQKIIFNLLSNAIKFTSNGGTIQLTLAKKILDGQDIIHLMVRDNGIGIKATDKEKLFNRFYQIDGTSTRMQEGTGIGLALVKELVELQNGTISVSSIVGQGTTFEVILPVSEAINVSPLSIPTLTEQQLLLVNDISQEQKEVVSTANTKKLDLLIIEDNKEIRQYIAHCLDQSKYNIIEASDGEEGIEKALEFVPDLIISDVMMPKKDGFEVIEAIRNEISTSHIPLILLTAKTALESRLKGFERGADAYLTKPFSPKELALRIRKLIEIRQGLQLRYQNGNHQTDSTNKGFAREDKFIIELKTFIMENLAEPDLKGDKIGQHFGLSRTSLYRKLKALTNQSVTEFIRTQRLIKAAELLSIGELTISEIAYHTGFSSPSYFARAFKKQYGKAPSEMK